jgi:hypothetical protein
VRGFRPKRLAQPSASSHPASFCRRLNAKVAPKGARRQMIFI